MQEDVKDVLQKDTERLRRTRKLHKGLPAVVCAQSDLWAACISVCQIVKQLAVDSSKEH